MRRPFRGDFLEQSGAWEGDNANYTGSPEDAARMPEFVRRMQKAMYRTLISGGSLAGVYQEPGFVVSRHPDSEIAAIHPNNFFQLTRRQLAFFDQFAISNMDSMPKEEETAFGPFGKWLLESILSDKEARVAMADRFEKGFGRARYCQRRGNCPVGFADITGSHSDAHLVVWELVQMIWAYQQLHHTITGLNTTLLPFDPPGYTLCRRAKAIFFGRFEVEEIMLPASLPTKAELSSPDHPQLDIRRTRRSGVPTFAMHFLGAIYTQSERPNRYRESGSYPGVRDAVPGLDIKFFGWFIDRYLDLSFAPDTFISVRGANQDYRDLVNSFAIFSHDDVGGRVAHDPDEFWFFDADFLDGSELLIRTDPSIARYYHVDPPPDPAILNLFNFDVPLMPPWPVSSVPRDPESDTESGAPPL